MKQRSSIFPHFAALPLPKFYSKNVFFSFPYFFLRLKLFIYKSCNYSIFFIFIRIQFNGFSNIFKFILETNVQMILIILTILFLNYMIFYFILLFSSVYIYIYVSSGRARNFGKRGQNKKFV